MTPAAYADAVEAITPEIRAAATDTELRKPGTGIRFVLNALSVEVGR
jgi:hypothetical protein